MLTHVSHGYIYLIGRFCTSIAPGGKGKKECGSQQRWRPNQARVHRADLPLSGPAARSQRL